MDLIDYCFQVTDEMQDQLIDKHPYVTVLFYDKDDKADLKILTELENIDVTPTNPTKLMNLLYINKFKCVL